MTEQLIKLHTDDEHFIALWRCFGDSPNGEHIWLSHGTFSNRKVLMGIVAYLVNQNYTCWISEWRGHGSSSRSKEKFNFETIAKQDIKLVFEYLFIQQALDQVQCITHSGGGICLSMYLIHNPQYSQRINSIVFFGCQAFGAIRSKYDYYKIKSGAFLACLLGFIPGKIANSPENESYHMMEQWFRWNLTKEFTGKDGIDYKEQLSKIRIPVLSICGGGDLFIAPPSGCESFLAAFDNSANKLLIYSKANGHIEDYNHGRILHSSSASKEIYPVVLEWLIKSKL